MTKAELIRTISDNTSTPQDTVEKVLDELRDVVCVQIKNGGDVTIPGLIKLGTTQRAARKGRNPATGEEIDIPAKTAVTAKPLKALKDHVA
ncbi:MAG: HU family DNA-binding protein [Pelagimonas sp.]|jgi:DNA-binding protein HU-beta|nr:HU family DNA-binding protein [Pelagimonas sp.]